MMLIKASRHLALDIQANHHPLIVVLKRHSNVTFTTENLYGVDAEVSELYSNILVCLSRAVSLFTVVPPDVFFPIC